MTKNQLLSRARLEMKIAWKKYDICADMERRGICVDWNISTASRGEIYREAESHAMQAAFLFRASRRRP
jgi:hypothetical protein